MRKLRRNETGDLLIVRGVSSNEVDGRIGSIVQEHLVVCEEGLGWVNSSRSSCPTCLIPHSCQGGRLVQRSSGGLLVRYYPRLKRSRVRKADATWPLAVIVLGYGIMKGPFNPGRGSPWKLRLSPL